VYVYIGVVGVEEFLLRFLIKCITNLR